jgi:O-succinylbenzoate synthase
VIKDISDAVNAATCALARISTFRSTTGHREDCSWCKKDPRDLCQMVAEFMGDSANSASIRLYESQAAQKTMESMWQ